MTDAPQRPIPITDRAVRCACNRLLFAFATRPWQTRCGKCHRTVGSADPERALPRAA